MITLNKWTWIRQAKNNYLRSRQFLGMHIPFDQVEYRHYPAVWYLVDYVLYSTIGIYSTVYTSIVLQYGVLRVPGTPSTVPYIASFYIPTSIQEYAELASFKLYAKVADKE